MLRIAQSRGLQLVVGHSLLVALLLLAGCGGQPQIASENRQLVVSLATAVSARNTEWLESNARILESHRSEGKCSDVEYRTFQGIIDQARAGQWKQAEDAVYSLRDAQKPTAEDLKNLEARRLDPDHAIARKVPVSSRRGH